MQPIIKFEVWGQIFINTNSYLPGAYIFRSVLGLYDLLLIYRIAPPPEALVGVCSIE